MSKFTCSICGSSYDELEDYLKCVSECGNELKEEMEFAAKEAYKTELNAAINKVKEAEKYYKDTLANFKEKYPEEYSFNFEKKKTEKVDESKEVRNERPNNIEDFWSMMKIFDDGDGSPKVEYVAKDKPKVETTMDELLKNPEVKDFMEILGIC